MIDRGGIYTRAIRQRHPIGGGRWPVPTSKTKPVPCMGGAGGFRPPTSRPRKTRFPASKNAPLWSPAREDS